ncbi:MAG: ABC transporter ATP-binding protein [Clostridia bacterium]
MNSISTQNLKIGYQDTIIVPKLDITLEKGKITSIIGPNGCGKSTVLKAISRLLKPKSGTVLINDTDMKTMPTKEIAKLLAILPQTPVAPSGLTCEELVAYGRFPYQKGFGKLSPQDKEIINWAMQATRLTEFANREIGSLSGGQRQKVWIAMALAQQTGTILLDEPTTYLDLAHQLEVLDLLVDLNVKHNCTIVMVLHDLNLASRFSNYLLAMKSGHVVKYGTPEEVMTNEILKECFNIDATIMLEKSTGKYTCVTYNLLDRE